MQDYVVVHAYACRTGRAVDILRRPRSNVCDQLHRAGGITIGFTAEQRLDHIIGDMNAEELRAMVRRYMRENANGADKQYMCICAWQVFEAKPHTDRGVYYMEELYHLREQFQQELN